MKSEPTIPQAIPAPTSGALIPAKDSASEMLHSFLSDALSPLVGVSIPIGRRLMQRGVGDIIEKQVCDRLLAHVAGHELDIEATPASSKRAIEDVLVKLEGKNFYVDVKSRDSDLTFSMPNLISIDRLDKLYRNPNNLMKLVMVDYRRNGPSLVITGIWWLAIEEICWKSLSIQNIGKGQLQITNARKLIGIYERSRAEWIGDLYAAGSEFYRKLARKALARGESWSNKRYPYVAPPKGQPGRPRKAA